MVIIIITIIFFITVKTQLLNLTSITTRTACHTGQQWYGLYCHAGQQQGLARADKLPNMNSAKLLMIQSDKPGLHLLSIHQIAPPKWGSTHPKTALLLIYRPRKDERLSWPSWLTCSRCVAHISGHLSGAVQTQDRESKITCSKMQFSRDGIPLGGSPSKTILLIGLFAAYFTRKYMAKKWYLNLQSQQQHKIMQWLDVC